MKVELPKAFQELLTAKARYKMFYGGRAGGKSFAFADALLTLATSRKLLIACVREVQNSIKDSVYKLIADRIAYYRLGDYRLYDDRIVNLKNKSKFILKGLWSITRRISNRWRGWISAGARRRRRFPSVRGWCLTRLSASRGRKSGCR